MKSFKKWSGIICLILIGILVMAGCSSNQPANDPAPAPAPANPASAAPASEAPAPAPAASGEKITIKIATANGDGDVKTVAARKMKEELEARSGGRITVDVYPAGQLLNDTAMVDGIPNGTADIGICGLGWWSGKVPEVTIVGAMGVFDSADHYWTTFESELFDYLGQKFEENADTKVLAWMYCGMSECILTRNKPVHMPDDMKGLKIRVPNNAMGSAVQALGASPVVIPVADVYTSLSSGVVDGTWGSLGNIHSNKFWDVVSYVTQLSLAYSDAYGIIVAESTWNKWPEDLRELIAEVSVEMYHFSHQYMDETNGAIWEEIQTYPNLEVYFVPEADIPAFAELTAPGQLELIKSTVPEQSYQDMINIIEKYRK